LRIADFILSEAGALKLRWTVLTVACVGVALVTVSAVASGVEDLSIGLQTDLASPGLFRDLTRAIVSGIG
jgi:hypothetical protein